MFSFLTPTGGLALRLPARERNAFLEAYETRLCEQHGTVLKEYVEVPDALLESTGELSPFLLSSRDYVSSLKPKPTKRPKNRTIQEVTMSQQSAAPTADLKAAAMDFLRLVASGKVQEAYRLYVGPDFRHHNAYFRGDAESLRVAMEENAVQSPNKVLEIQRALGDGDLVAVHSRIRQTPEDPGAAVVHIFRFEGDLVAEAWDVGQAVPEDSPNENGMF